MTKIVFDLVSVVGASHPDDAVTFRAPFMRRSKNRQGIVTTRRERLDLSLIHISEPTRRS